MVYFETQSSVCDTMEVKDTAESTHDVFVPFGIIKGPSFWLEIIQYFVFIIVTSMKIPQTSALFLSTFPTSV